MSYKVTTFDVCVSGSERLRTYEEFILAASIDAETDSADLLEQWISEIDACGRPDDFDFDAAHEAVSSYYEEKIKPLFARKSNPFSLDPRSVEENESFEGDGCYAFLYVQVQGANFPVY